MKVLKLLGASMAAAALVILQPVLSSAQETSLPLAVTIKGEDTKVTFAIEEQLTNISLTVSGPRGYRGRLLSEDREFGIDLEDFGNVDDGTYAFNIAAPSGKKYKLNTQKLRTGRPNEDLFAASIPAVFSGQFLVEDGKVVFPDNESETQGGNNE